MRIGLFGLALAGVPLADAQAIYSASEQAGPGATISVRGDSLDATARFTVYPYTSMGKRGGGVQVAPDTATGKVATLRLPRSFGNTVYEVLASTLKGATNSVFVNRPRMQWTDVPDAMPGQIVRVVGRNFQPFANVTPTVSLVNAATKAVVTPAIVSVSDTVIKIQLPTGTAAGNYTMSLGTGIAGALSTDPSTLALTVRAAAADPFSLGVAWGADCNGLAANVYNVKTDPRIPHCAGNGATEDGAALSAALYLVSQRGGGVVYLPAGTYRIDDGSAWSVIYGNTVLRGAGKGQTILQTGYVYNPSNAAPDYHYTLAMCGGNNGPEGIADLTIQNFNTNNTPNGILMGYGGVTKEAFLKNVDFQMGNGKNAWISTPNKLMIADCNFTSTGMNTGGSLRVTGATEFQYLRNTEYHRSGRLALNMGQRGVLEGNTIHFDNNYRNASTAETGAVELSEGQQILVLDNEIGALGNAPNRPAGDGELILTQLAQLGDFMYTGMVRTAAQRVLVPTAAFPTTAWQDANYPTPTSRMAVMIVSGKGAGQWRRATSWTSSSVVLDQAWLITPDTTSRFAIASLNNYQQTYANNRLFGGFYGIEWEDGAIDSTAEGNTLTNTGFIGLLAYTCDARNGQWGANGSNYSFTPAWNDAILKNTLNNTDGSRPATITVGALDTMNLNLGPLVLGTDVRNNTIVGHFTQPIASQYGKTDGLEVMSLDPGFPFIGNDVLNQGTVLQDNAISNSDYPVVIYNMSTGFLSNGPSSA